MEKTTGRIRRWMYGEQFTNFINQDENSILGELLSCSSGSVESTQRNAWLEQIRIMKSVALPDEVTSAHIYFELTVPRLGRRADVVLIVDHIMLILEFKTGEASFTRSALDQVWDYALDFKNFHNTSHNIYIVPVLIPTGAMNQTIDLRPTLHEDGLIHPVCASPFQIHNIIEASLSQFAAPEIDVEIWECGRYQPTPTIVEAARALYAGHAVEDISRSDSGAKNLALTAKCVDDIIERTRKGNRKAICFVTGVPGAGKTLVGLDVAMRHLNPDSETYSVFLSGNGPLVAVLREALARDRVEQSIHNGKKMRKGDARKEVEAFIQNVHHFRDEYLRDSAPPPEHVVLFDEAQRAWSLDQTSAFMQQKKGLSGFNQSEPEFLISCLDRHEDWAVVICLVGSGQEINTGEAGISEWFEAVLQSFPSWDVHLSSSLTNAEYSGGDSFERMIARNNTFIDKSLHLATSMRSFRAETLSDFVRNTLELEVESAKRTLSELIERYPIMLTRDIDQAKFWLRQQARGSERYGMVVSSRAERLKPHAIDVRVKTDPVKWFLEGKDDTRSSFYLEDAATEFQVQGLELDWACIVWDGDLRCGGDHWTHHQFRGSRWMRVNKPERQRYLENTYRVLLTRARQGMVVVVPPGDDNDPTRMRKLYDPTYDYLKSLGLREL